MGQQHPYKGSSVNMSRCIDDCDQCNRVCWNMALNYCLERGGAHSEPTHLRMLLGCAEVCRTAASLMLSGFALHALVCSACADICDKCADDCERVGDMDECVAVCRRCAESCREMVRSQAMTTPASTGETRSLSAEDIQQALSRL